MDWLENEVEKNDQKIKREQELNIFFNARADLMKKSWLPNLEKTALEFIERFEQFTGVQQRDFIERMIAKIIFIKDNVLELHVLWDPKERRHTDNKEFG